MTWNVQQPHVLQRGVAAHKAGRLADAEAAYRQVLAAAPDNADALQLLGLVCHRTGRADEAVRLMRRSLELAPGQPQVWNNLGNVWKATGDLDRAIDHYRRATELSAGYVDAWRNLGTALASAGRADDAIDALGRAIALKPADAGLHNALGLAFKAAARWDDALAAFRDGLARDASHVRCRHNLATTLADRGQPGEALAHCDAAVKLAPDMAELYHVRGNILLALGRLDEAIAAWERALDLRPDFAEAHYTLNKLLWEHGRHDQVLTSFPTAIARAPDNAYVRVQYAASLMQMDRLDEAEAVLRETIDRVAPVAEACHGLGMVLHARHRYEQAVEWHARAVGASDRADWRVKYAGSLIGLADYAAALAQLDAAEAAQPDNQLLLAYKGLCWRMLGDDRDGWLNDYDRFVQPMALTVPDGFADAAAFNRALDTVLSDLHRTRQHPLDQTLRGGTQTIGALFDEPIPIVQQVRAAIEQAVAGYIDRLPDDASHPLLRRKSDRFGFAGSWSCRLRDQGYHTDHVHSAGWISSAYYVALPDAISADDPDRRGWIKFGQPDLDVGPAGAPRRQVMPRVGTLVLFPSYMWHGTVPFSSAQVRTTIAFDVVPA